MNPIIQSYTATERDQRLALAREIAKAAADAQRLADELQSLADELLREEA